MDSAKIIFILFSGILFFVIPLIVQNVRHYFLGLASSLYVFSSGWIFYHYNGLMLADLPIFGLLILSAMSDKRLRWSAPPVSFPLLGLIIWGIITSFSAINPGWAFSETTKYMRMYVLIVVLVHHIQSMHDLRVVVNGMLIGLAIQVVIGIYQWRFGATGLWFLGERPWWRIRWRTAGTFFVPSFYANYLSMLLPVVFRLFLYYHPPNRKWSYFYGGVLVFGCVALFTTYGRGPWIGFAVSITLLLLAGLFFGHFRARIRWTFSVILVFALAFVIRYGPKVMDQFGADRDASYDVRFPQFRIAQRMINDNIFLGVGLGNYELVSYDYMTFEERADNMAGVYRILVHNSYLLILSESGLFGGFFLVAWFVTIFVAGIQVLLSRLRHPYFINITLGILAGMTAIIIVFTFSPDIHAYQILYQLSIFSAILVAEKRLIKNALSRKRPLLQNQKRTIQKRSIQ